MISKRQLSLFLTLLVLSSGGCAVQVNEAAPTSSAVLITSTLPTTLTAASSETPLPPLPQPTVAPVEGTSSTQINVRSEPSTSGSILGIIPPDTRVQIIGKDPGGNWWQILYEQGVDGRGWVTAQYVTTVNSADIPVIGGDPADPTNGNVAIAQQQINVRSGPGTDFNSLGTLNAQDVVSLTGKDANGAWLQIAYPAGPDGKGWVNGAFVQARGVENLPIITEAGQIVGTGTPTGIPSTPTPTVIPAWSDGDSQTSPIVNVVFEPSGTSTLIYSGDISSPEGDLEDWITFKLDDKMVIASLSCTGNDSLQAEILENGLLINAGLTCGDAMKQIPVKPGASYSVHLFLNGTTSALQYCGYTIKIESIQ